VARRNPLANTHNLELLSFGRSLLHIPSREQQLTHILATLKSWFGCEGEFQLFKLEQLEGSKAAISTFADEIPQDLCHFLLDLYQDVPAAARLFQSAMSFAGKRPGKTLSVPVLFDHGDLAIFRLLKKDNGFFTQLNVEIVKSLLSYLALLHAVKMQETSQASLLAELTTSIMSMLNLDDLLDEAARQLHHKFNFPNVFLFVVHPGRRKITFQTGCYKNLPGAQPGEIELDLDSSEGVLPRAAREMKSCLLGDIAAESGYQSAGILPSARSEMIVPIVFGQEVLGIIDVLSEEAHAFTQEDAALLEAAARNIAVAMRNAILYRSEQWRRRVAESLREVAGLLTADVDLNKLLDVILDELEKVLPCDYASVWLLENHAEKDRSNAARVLMLSSVHLSDSRKKSGYREHDVNPELIFQVCSQAPYENPWLLEALESKQPLIRQGQSPYDPIASILDFDEKHSAIAAPLMAGDQKLGLLLLGHHTAGRYGHEAQMITSTFASYAAVAIQNARLFSAAHDQAWVSTVLLQVADATQSINDLNELLDTMARITPMLIGINACVIFTWDEDLRVFTPRTAYGLETEAQTEMMRWVIHPGEFAEFDQLSESTNAIMIERQPESEANNHLYALFPEETGLLALFPMTSHGKFLGAFLVDFADTLLSDLSETQPGKLDDYLAIIQGIAHQTAVAVNNLQLLESQKEEAYVSIALLQVAQAVVSLNSLQDIIAAIVRITPILVGVKRVVVYLWDEAQQIFTLYQSYGISRQEMAEIQKIVHPAEFPLIKCVRDSGKPAFAAYSSETDHPSYWDRIPEHEVVLGGLTSPIFSEVGSETPENISEYENILSKQSGLLYAYPLSVKGDLLGIFIAQEIYDSAYIISPRVRARRQEITIGITQQASLAIQNEYLQREAVERERLERELQLAREIQQSFLPNTLPRVPDWDVAALWKPAREVGGDFYDAFPLPGNRLGVVIADVADKGIPAALFMTLARTLIRATAREEFSPAIVLETVNDLLVAETERGLFITTFYMVVSPQTGQLLYANAGHNPPLVLRKSTQSIERLPATGMALGVLESIHIKENALKLEVGDRVVLYTDGITEAFSSYGEMYGEERLQALLLDCLQREIDRTAAELLNHIADSVHEFSEGAPISDDITLVTLRRLA